MGNCCPNATNQMNPEKGEDIRIINQEKKPDLELKEVYEEQPNLHL